MPGDLGLLARATRSEWWALACACIAAGALALAPESPRHTVGRDTTDAPVERPSPLSDVSQLGMTAPAPLSFSAESLADPFAATVRAPAVTLEATSTRRKTAPRPVAATSTSPAPPPPAPAAPPLPFTGLGSMRLEAAGRGGDLVAFLKRQDSLLIVRAGDSIQGTYRVENISTERVQITYLPLMQRQSIPLSPSP